MPIQITSIQNQQNLEVVVSGPGAANRMYIVSGIGSVGLGAGANAGSSANRQETFTVLVGPTLTSVQFVEALATAAPASFQLYMGDPPQAQATWRVTNVDADFDDESGQTELSIEASVDVYGTSASISSLAFQATILAAV